MKKYILFIAVFTLLLCGAFYAEKDSIPFGSATLIYPYQGGTGFGSYTRGDLLVATSSSSFIKLPVGANGQVLKVSGGMPSWGTDLTGSGGSGLWATSTFGIYPIDSSYDVVIGDTTTTSAPFWMDVSTGDLTISGNLISADNFLTGVAWGDITGTLSDQTDLQAELDKKLSTTTAESTYVKRNDWTTIDDYPTGCSAGNYVQAIGDTLTCAADQDTTYSAGGTLLNLTGTTFSINEGTLTDGKGCKYVSGTGLVCDQGYLTTVDISDDTNLSVSATGLELSGDSIALTTGYTIPLSASTTNWETFYQTPSNRITAGTGLSWSSNTLNWSSSGLTWQGNAIGTAYGGTGQDTSGWTGLIRISGGTWGTTTIDISDDTNLGVSGTLLQLSGDTLSIKEGTLTSGKLCKYDSTSGLVCNYDDSDTTYTAGGTLLQLSGTEFSIKEGTLTSGKLCKYDSTNGLVCDYDDQDTTYSAGTGLDLTGTTFSLSHLGLESLTDPNANRLYYWNDTNNTTEWLDYSNWDTDKTDDLTTATTFSGDVSGAYNNLTIGDDKVTEADLKVVNSPTDEYCLTYEATGGDFEWQDCGTGGSSEWTDSGTFLYPTETSDDIVIGSNSTSTAPFWFDVSATTSYLGTIGSGTTWNGNKIDISDYTNLAVSSPITLTGDTIGFDDTAVTSLSNLATVGTITSGTWQGSVIDDAYISNTLTLDSGSTIDKGALANTGTLGFDWQDSEIADNITVSNYLPLSGGTITGDLTINGTTTLATTIFSNLASGFLKLDANGKVSTSTIDISDDTNLAVSGTLLNLTGDTLSVNEGTLTDGKLCKYVAGTGIVCDYTDQDTTYTAGGTLLQLSGTQFSVKEGTLTSGKLCKYDSTNGLVCNYDDSDTTYSAGTGLDLTGTTFSLSHLGLESLTDPNANRLYYWNDTNNTSEWLDYSNWDTDKTDDLTTATTFSGDVSGTYNNLTIQANSVELGTDTTGNYAAGDAEGGNATGLACSGCVDISSETNLTAGRSLTLNGDTIDIDSEIYTGSFSITIKNATTSANPAAQRYNPVAITITKIGCRTDSGSATIQFDERTSSGDSAGTDVMSSGLTCDSTMDYTTSFSNSSIAANTWLSLDIDSISSATDIFIFVSYTKND